MKKPDDYHIYLEIVTPEGRSVQGTIEFTQQQIDYLEANPKKFLTDELLELWSAIFERATKKH